MTRGATLPAIADAYFLDTPGKVEALYLAALTRRPTAEESTRIVAYVGEAGRLSIPRRRLSDVFWSLLNSCSRPCSTSQRRRQSEPLVTSRRPSGANARS